MAHRVIVLLAVLFRAVGKLEGQALVPLDRSQRSVSTYILAGQGFLLDGQGFSEFVSPAVSVARPLSGRLEGQLDFHPAIVIRQPTTQPPTAVRQTVWAAALDIGLRWYPLSRDWKWTPYVEVFNGVLGARHRVPPRGTNFNFLSQAGLGVILPLGQRWHPFVAARWFHISNASLGRHNPAWDHWSIGAGGRLAFQP
jgi:hypothetical protein